MKALSLLQPWATLIMLGYKQFETRSWATKHRGPLAIAASGGTKGREACAPGTYLAQLLANHNLTFDDLPRGAVLGVCQVVECLHIIGIGADAGLWTLERGYVVDFGQLAATEVAAGDYAPNRFAWQLAGVQAFATPIACKGALSLWEVPSYVEAQFPLSSAPVPAITETTTAQVDEEPYYDLATSEGQQQYRDAVELRATAWAENFEEPKQGDGDPYELGQGLDLWIDLVERWDDEFDGDAVSHQLNARKIGAEVCERVITTLVAKRSTEDDYFDCTCGAQLKRADNPQQCSCQREHA